MRFNYEFLIFLLYYVHFGGQNDIQRLNKNPNSNYKKRLRSIIKANKRLIRSKYIGKAKLVKSQTSMAKNPVAELNTPAQKGSEFSVSGYFQALIIIGKEAVKSATIDNPIAEVALCEKNQKAIARREIIPQIKSIFPIFQ